MDWLEEGVRKSIWSFILDFANDLVNKAFSNITAMVIQASNLNTYINVSSILVYFQYLAAAFLILAVAWEGLKQNSGQMISAEKKSVGTILLQVFWSGFLIYFMPWSLMNIFIPINNALVEFIKNFGVQFTIDNLWSSAQSTVITSGPSTTNRGGVNILLYLFLGLAYFILGLVASIRYIELIIAYLIAPFVAVSAVRTGDAINVWVRETTAIVFTQVLHIFLLKIVMIIFQSYFTSQAQIILSIACIVVMLRGPQVLRTFLYASGTGSVAVNAVGAGGKMAAMKFLTKSTVKV
jgi:hypothetical protein